LGLRGVDIVDMYRSNNTFMGFVANDNLLKVTKPLAKEYTPPVLLLQHGSTH
jgi:hypothetical protein